MLTGVKCTVAAPPCGLSSPHWRGMEVMWEQEVVVGVWAGSRMCSESGRWLYWSFWSVLYPLGRTCSQDVLQLWESRQEEFIG